MNKGFLHYLDRYINGETKLPDLIYRFIYFSKSLYSHAKTDISDERKRETAATGAGTRAIR